MDGSYRKRGFVNVYRFLTMPVT